MRKIEYAPLVKKKMIALKAWLTEHYDRETAQRILTGIISDAERLEAHPKSGTNIAEMYTLDTEYWYLFTHQHYLVYRIEAKKVVIVQMFNEREDFLMMLFGMSGRTQESIDYWGE